jgi:hypothetical protein
MRARHAVLLTPSKSSCPAQLLSCKQTASITLLESTLVEVFILNNLNLFRINTYEKHRGEGGRPSRALLASAPSGDWLAEV